MTALLSDVDEASATLISQLFLEDIGVIQRRASNEEYALRTLEEETMRTIQYLSDLEMARSLDNALELDQPVLAVLSTIEEGALDDHRYAQALNDGSALPEQSEVQRLMEDPEFVALSRDIVDASTAPENISSDEHEEDTEEDSEEEAREDIQPAPLSPATNSGPWINARGRRAPRKRLSCIICHDSIHAQFPFESTCGHFYCTQCLTSLTKTCIGDETLYPLQCCRQVMLMDGPRGVFARLPLRLALQFRRKVNEFATPAGERLYCPTSTCSAFIGSTATQPSNTCHCRACDTEICVLCKEVDHPGEICGGNATLEEVKELARTEGWQTCPGCANIIELHQGCFHMTCRCRTEFCYVCAVRWKNCQCPQWEEQRLLDTAAQRVEREMGARARVIAPERFEARVQERVERLRYAHDCANGHNWGRRAGGGRCEECHDTLPIYLMLCGNCGIAVCFRCARNRL
ncbi:RBR-type E3 ubiquitin transferase [Mycena indigotica]|uniref:RBR-type E3 ubiquitin transferase n=1 Tax=Mycena indigotica TaxID=2126181 RepID=A0A8H6WEK3_9AGAR|nr:RBR-type E3 ubiquitin transferase [Mycena indigotica]KAF7311943.1 RBR-type E3 ubiquitin transferase [Mycena indigotica]